MIGIIDYGRGNLRSVENVLQKLGFVATVFSEPERIGDMAGLILPGVGAFGDAMAALRAGNWVSPIRQFVADRRPFLGVCLGMQVLFEIGEEHGRHEGLGILPGRVVKFPVGRKIPHMGWNNLNVRQVSPLLAGIPVDSYFYFVHSYYVLPKEEGDVLASSDYVVTFPAVVGRGRVWGTQFHPEKSSPWGLQLLTNFGRLVKDHVALSGN